MNIDIINLLESYNKRHASQYNGMAYLKLFSDGSSALCFDRTYDSVGQRNKNTMIIKIFNQSRDLHEMKEYLLDISN